MIQEIFNKVEQNKRTSNVGKFLSTQWKHYSQKLISSRAEMSCGTPPTGKWGWMIVSYMRVWMGLTDNWQMAKILTDNWQIAENLTDYWHLPWVLLSNDKGPYCPLFSTKPRAIIGLLWLLTKLVLKALNSIVALFSSDNVIKCAFLGVILL